MAFGMYFATSSIVLVRPKKNATPATNKPAEARSPGEKCCAAATELMVCIGWTAIGMSNHSTVIML
jgi:hypothetical protein